MTTDPGARQAANDPGRPLAYAGLLAGIVGVPLAFIPFIGVLSFVAAAVAVVVGLIAMRRAELPETAALARWAVALGVIAALVALVWVVIIGIFS